MPDTPKEDPSTFLTSELLDHFRNDYNAPSNASQHIARNALTHARLSKVIIDPNRVNALHTTFSDELDIATSTSDQVQSGRCWLFSFLNVLRAHMVKRYELNAEFEFSQAYLFFWDQLEKCNWFLHTIWTLIRDNKPNDDPHVRELLKEPLSDGGQWHMIQNLVRKYGVVPRHAMHESYQANRTEQMTGLLSSRLREFAYQIRQRKDELVGRPEYESAIQPMMYEIYTILCVFLGEPPKTIRWEYNPSEVNWAKEQWKEQKKQKEQKEQKEQKKQKARTRKSNKGASTHITASPVSTTNSSHDRRSKSSRTRTTNTSKSSSSTSVYAIDKKPFEESRTLTPVEYYRQYVDHKDLAIQDYVTVIHYPHSTRPYNRCYTVNHLNNMEDGPGVKRAKLYNVPIHILKTITRRSIDVGEPVWFCADVNKDVSDTFGIMDPQAFQYTSIFGHACVPFGWDKGERMMHKDGVPNHAMVLRGYHVEPPAELSHSDATTRQSATTSASGSRSKKSRRAISRTHQTRTKKQGTTTRKVAAGGVGVERGKTLSTPSAPSVPSAPSAPSAPTSRWLVENSWGSLSGIDGNYVMSDEWFNRHVYEVAVHKRHLKGLWKGKRTSDADENDIVLEMWDVFGSLF